MGNYDVRDRWGCKVGSLMIGKHSICPAGKDYCLLHTGDSLEFDVDTYSDGQYSFTLNQQAGDQLTYGLVRESVIVNGKKVADIATNNHLNEYPILTIHLKKGANTIQIVHNTSSEISDVAIAGIFVHEAGRG